MDSSPRVLGLGLKMYLGYQQTLEWAERVAEIAAQHPVVTDGTVELFVVPSFPMLMDVRRALDGSAVGVGAQDVFWEDRGPFTGEVSAADLAEIGCSYVEVGHAERRRLFAETDDIISQKVLAVFRNGLIPVLCIGERSQGEPEAAAAECRRQLHAGLAGSRGAGLRGRLVVAYEPQWAIGAEQPASHDHIRITSEHLRDELATDDSLAGSSIIYGGSAGTGQLAQIGGAVDGLFLGRFAHDTDAFASLLDEVRALPDPDAT